MERKPHHGLSVPPHPQEAKPEAGLDDTQGLGEEVPFLTYRCFIENATTVHKHNGLDDFLTGDSVGYHQMCLMSSLGLSCNQVRV